MCEALRDLMKDEIDAELNKGIEQGVEQGTLSSISNLMKSMHWSAEQAMAALGIPKEKMDFYGAKLANRN